ncbi:hypothetical protein CR194_09870 [Salipaludibacillus keqinensis]|uniref:Phosphohydrolase n=1 Tax=Salipaludibacillus keqinensis TaxID=2045207 RepID=A0A323TEY0_9BACI|nr:HD-GYP domain-containing protein [Salipaludibacillus keqinensis]PYZ93469.1 hypothetical protein CR194_09870 [Salipaludibacillus keqinensis]
MKVFEQFQKQLVLNYLLGSVIAVFGVGSVFIFHTLQLAAVEILLLVTVMIVSVAIMLAAELALFKKHIRPLKKFFQSDLPNETDFKKAFTVAHRFPILTVQRILGPHLFGLSIPASILYAILIYNGWIHFEYYYIALAWAGAILIAVMHALIEFFLTYRASLILANHIYARAKREQDVELFLETNQLISYKVKLLISSLFTAVFPVLLFIVALQIRTVESNNYSLENYWSWALVIVLVILGISITTGILLYRNIQEPIDQLRGRFEEVGKGNFETLDKSYSDEFAHLVSGFNSMVIGIKERDNRNDQLINSFFSVFAATLDARDPYTAGHSSRVANYAVRIARKADFPEKQEDLLKKSALLHDIGKIGIRDHILLKESRLTEEEFEQIKQHPVIGTKILEQVDLPEEWTPILPGVQYHHERYDGKGYPEGLKGNDIPTFGRLLAVADAFDAMTSDRPYLKGMDYERALNIIKEGRGTQFDPYFANLFLEIMKEETKNR